MKPGKKTNGLKFSGIEDLELFEETVDRLCQKYRREHGIPFLYGSFEFVFHRGELKWIEERPRNKRFLDREEGHPPYGQGDHK